jgi:hypothetical protein
VRVIDTRAIVWNIAFDGLRIVSSTVKTGGPSMVTTMCVWSVDNGESICAIYSNKYSVITLMLAFLVYTSKSYEAAQRTQVFSYPIYPYFLTVLTLL